MSTEPRTMSMVDPTIPKNGIERAHTLVCALGADTAVDLAWEMRRMADDIEWGRLSVGCSGGCSSGGLYSYRVRPEQTHDEYFRQIDAWLEQEAKAKAAAALSEEAR